MLGWFYTLYIMHFRLVSTTVYRNWRSVYKLRREKDYYLRVGSDPKESLLGSVNEPSLSAFLGLHPRSTLDGFSQN